MKRPYWPATASLFAQLLMLVALSLAAAWIINLLVIFNLPPPAPDFYPVSEVAQAIEGRSHAPTPLHPPLISERSSRPPRLGLLPWLQNEDGPSPFKLDLAALIRRDPADILVLSDMGRFADRRAFRLVQNELAKGGHSRAERFIFPPFKIAVRQSGGGWLVVRPPPAFHLTPWQQMTMLGLLLSSLVVTLIAYVFAKRMAAPITEFAAAAERLGRDPRAPPLAVHGTSEIAVAVGAFNDMQERLGRYVEDRTAMIGAIAHDLRTPLTRLRFRLEAAPEGLRAKMAADIAEMEAMISGTLAFVADAARPGARAKLELSSLLESLADEMSETGLKVVVAESEKVVVDGDPIALRRLFNNLLENAIKYGGEAQVRVYREPGQAVVEIDDNGPGLPLTELDRVFEPFYRHEGSRSRQTGGIGLGLAVVRTVARAHGGDATLLNRIEGGITARVRLPLSAGASPADVDRPRMRAA
ncbi:MAG: HAMP domain-containing protein [Caulobacteraceae bacterium]|nr:HAMP domain-containing protein [Caulobacteraceae bacterium]